MSAEQVHAVRISQPGQGGAWMHYTVRRQGTREQVIADVLAQLPPGSTATIDEESPKCPVSR